MKKKFDSFNEARGLGTVNGRKNAKGALTRSDKVDFFEFNLSAHSSFSIEPKRIRSNLQVQLFDGDRDRIGKSKFKAKGKKKSLATDLDEGTYYIRVKGRTRSGKSRFKLRLKASIISDPTTNIPTTDDTFDNLPPGRDIGVLTGTYTNSDVVGADDDRDHYKFRLNEISTFTAQLSGVSQTVDLDLFYDNNGDGVFEEGEVFTSSRASATADGLITDTLPIGDYVVRVDSGFGSTNTTYNLTLTQSANPGNLPSDPGNTPTSAFDLGALSGERKLTDLVGELDNLDYYTFTLSQISNVSAQITGLSQSTRLQLFYDSNANGVFEENDFVSEFGNASSEIFFGDVLPTGRYLVLVDNSDFGNTNTRYELTLNQTSNPGTLATDPGGTPSTAFNLGNITAPRNIVDLVGDLDDKDYYSLRFTQATTATFQITGLSLPASLSLFYDSDNNGIFADTERVDRTTSSSNGGLFSDTWQAGNYLALVDAGSSFSLVNTKYELNIVPS